MKNPFDRWESKVKKTESGCWEWEGATYRGGYGHFRMLVEGKWKMYKAHRFSYEYHKNASLKSNDFVCHACDNPKCVNPSHLFVGNAKDNSDDKIKKGRLKTGRNLKHKWLSLDIAREIRTEYKKGKSLSELSEMFKTSKPQVCRIVNNKIWKEE